MSREAIACVVNMFVVRLVPVWREAIARKLDLAGNSAKVSQNIHAIPGMDWFLSSIVMWFFINACRRGVMPADDAPYRAGGVLEMSLIEDRLGR